MPGSAAAFFGQKRVALVCDLPETPAQAREQQQRGAGARQQQTKQFGDWIFDVRVLSREASLQLAVGLAHNYVQIWEPASDRVLRSVQCAERCILYALAFHGRGADELLVASGTVFQQILLWKPFGRERSSGADDDETAAVAPAQRLHSHDGVLFKLEWSSDASMLASVSDDRTVQLWSSRDADSFPAKSDARGADGFLESTHQTLAFMRQHLGDQQQDRPSSADVRSAFRSVFRSWGHSARLWDVKFCAYGLATTSEDAVCKIWDLAGNCIASLHGHVGRHAWRVAVHPSQAIVATGGADSAVKLWNLHDQAKSSSSDSDAFCQSIPLFAASPMKQSGKSKTMSVRDVVVDQEHGNRAFVASELGQIFAVDITSQTSSLFYDLGGSSSERQKRESFEADGDGESAKHVPPPNLSTLAMDSRSEALLIGDSVGVVSIVVIKTATLKHRWRAHDSRVIKVVWNREEDSNSLFTLSVDCTIREWRPVATSAVDGVSAMELVASFKSPGKSAASSLLVIDRNATRNIVCGDGRGNVFVFHRSLAHVTRSPDDDLRAAAPSLVLRGVHGREQVSSLMLHGELMYSGGHDGYLCSYVADFSRSSNDSENGGALSLRFIGRDSIKGMATIKSLWLSAARELFVLGFYASQAILHNFTAQYRLFSIECGGWRRPHALVTKDVNASPSLPAHTFLFTPPVANKAQLLELKVHSTITQSSAPPFQQPPLGKISLHYQYHGKMTTCVVKVGERLVTAADDNSIKLHRQQQQDTSGDVDIASSWECVSTGVAHTTTVRALTQFRTAGAHVLLSGGGKQRVSVWRVADAAEVIEFVCGFEREDALQDHRILGLATFAVRPSADGSGSEQRYRLVTACNSEGSIQLLLLDLERATLVELGEVSSSKKPILSCAGFQHRSSDTAYNDAAVLAVGSTDGMITVWSFAGLVRELERSDDLTGVTGATFRRLLSYLVPAESYLAHDMGVNCIAIAHYDATSFSIISGGDDQSVRLREYKTGGESYEVGSDTRAINASGSAIKAVYSDGSAVFLAGYDQRVSKWKIVTSSSSSSNDGVKAVGEEADASTVESRKALEWQCAAFSECADIADLVVWESEERSDSHMVAVVGQGLQVIRFRK